MTMILMKTCENEMEKLGGNKNTIGSPGS